MCDNRRHDIGDNYKSMGNLQTLSLYFLLFFYIYVISKNPTVIIIQTKQCYLPLMEWYRKRENKFKIPRLCRCCQSRIPKELTHRSQATNMALFLFIFWFYNFDFNQTKIKNYKGIFEIETDFDNNLKDQFVLYL